VLKLAYSRIGADGLRILSSLDQVEGLALEGCGLVDDQALAELAHWKSLKYLDVQETKGHSAGCRCARKSQTGPRNSKRPVSADVSFFTCFLDSPLPADIACRKQYF
jgi:hypothetical protein